MGSPKGDLWEVSLLPLQGCLHCLLCWGLAPWTRNLRHCKSWPWGRKTRRWDGEGVFCLGGILVQNWGSSLQPRVGFSRGRVPRAGAAGTEGRTDRSGCSWGWSRQPSSTTEFISFLLDSVACLLCCLPVRSRWWDPLHFVEPLVDWAAWPQLPSEALSTGSAKPCSRGRWLLPVAFCD